MKTQEATSTSSAFRLATTTIAGVILLAMIPSILSNGIPNPLLWGWKKLGLDKFFLQNSVSLFLEDGSTPLNGAVVKASYPDHSGNMDGFEFLSYFHNNGTANTGAMEFQYYLGDSWPKPESSILSDEPGYPFLNCAIISWRENDAAPGSRFRLPLGLRFGKNCPSLPAGKHSVFLKIVNPNGDALYKGKFTVEIANTTAPTANILN